LYFASWLFSGSTHTCSGSVISTEAADGKNKSEAFYGVDADGHAFERFIRPILSKYTIAGTPQLSLRRKLRHDTLRRPRCRSSPRRPKRQATYLMNARQGGEFSWNTTHTPPGRGFGGAAAAPGTVENGTNFMPDLAYRL